MRLKFAVALLAASFSLYSQTLPQGVQKTAAVAGITEYSFPNGLRVLLYPDASSPKVTVNMTYLVGSRFEGYGETGMAHLLEHLNFILSTNGRDIKKELSDHGAQFNGTTDYDRTNYFETVTASDDNLKWALSLEADRMVNMRIEKPLLDKEMTVVRNEFEMGENSPQRILEERVMSTAYLWHNYGKSVIGSRADIEKVPIDRLAAFYKKYYQPDNAVLVIAGQFDPSKALAWTNDTVGAIPRPARKLDETYTEEPVQDGARSVELRRVGKGKSVMIAWHGPAMANADSAALEVLSELMSGPNGTGRLYKALVDNKKALTVRMENQEMHDPGLIVASATLSDEQSIDDARKAILDTIAGIVAEPPSKDEVERLKTRSLRSMERSLANSQQFAVSLTEMIADGDWRVFFTNYDQLKAVTPEDVVRVAKLYFKDSNSTVGVFIPTENPDRTVVPATPDLAAVFKDYKSSLGASEAEAFDPSPANIEKHITRVTLPNGLRLTLLPKTNRTNAASASLDLRFGDEKSLAGRNAVAELTGAILMRGTKTKNRQQLQEAMDKLDARVMVGGGGRGGGGRGLGSVNASIQQAPAANFIPSLRLAAEILREPAFPEAEFDQIKAQQIAAIERSRTEPDTLARLALQRALSPFPPTDARYVRTLEEQIADLKKVTLDDVKKFYAQFYGASHADLVVVGQFDPAAVRSAAQELFGSWNSASPWARIGSKYLPTTPINLKIETPDKQNAEFEAGLRIHMSDTDPDYAAMVLADYMFGGTMSSRLPNRVRNKEGLSYGVGSGFTAASDGDAAAFSAVAICNPRNTPKVEASFKDELAKTLANGFTAQEVAEAQKAVHDERVVGRSQDQALLGLILTRANFDRTLAWDEQMDAKLAALTVDQVNAAFRRHVNPAAFLIVKAGDFKTAGVYQQ
ncbi:MAG: pitrilysin family protein [Bryobacteraceae bacterium]